MSQHRSDQHGGDGIDLVLISMPFGILNHPSIALSLLSGSLSSMQVSSKIIHFTLPFAEMIGPSLYKSIALGRHSTIDQVGEWIFSKALFSNYNTDDYIKNVILAGTSLDHLGLTSSVDEFCHSILELRDKVDDFLTWCLNEVIKIQPRIVGFTSVFQQQVASLALAQRIKQYDPKISIIFGGANCEGVMGAEIIRQFPFVDIVVSGEGDIIFPELISRILNHNSLLDLNGVYMSSNIDFIGINNNYLNATSVQNMDVLPVPSYEEYFAQKASLGLDDLESIIPFESSRGCWWGAKNHCTFCGLNGITMNFRSKTGSRALDELLSLSNSYPGHPIAAVDNILDTKYFKTFIPELIARKLDLKLFYEVKANLKKHELQLLSEAGVTKIQPGIESLSTPILQGMRKGIKFLQNIQLLKWCKEFRIEPSWNILWGFPGENPEEYNIMMNILPLLAHFTPPITAGPVRLDRFSPLYIQGEQNGLMNIRPYPAYSYVYPDLSDESRANLAYYFTYDYDDDRNVTEYTRHIPASIDEWKQVHHRSELYIVAYGADILLWDLRPIAEIMITRMGGLEKDLYLACDGVQGVSELARIAEAYLGSVSKDHIKSLMMNFVDRKLMLTEGDSFLGLAVLLHQDSPKMVEFQDTLRVLQKLHRIPNYYLLEDIIPA
jgi:ribosomal peptide maturation radical SAM protein 1